MLRHKLLTVFAVALLSLSSVSPVYGQQTYANSLVRSVSSPDLQPGQSGTLSVDVSNAFNRSMDNIVMTLSIYAFVDGSAYVPSSSIPSSHLPRFMGSGQPAESLTVSSIPVNASYNFSFPLQTGYGTPHGTFFNEGTYMVSMSIIFTIGFTLYRMASRGFFSPVQWQKIYVQNGSFAYLNYTYLNSTLGFAGILPDTSFGVNTPAPWYLFFASGVLAAAFGTAAFFSYRRTHRRVHGKSHEKVREAP